MHGEKLRLMMREDEDNGRCKQEGEAGRSQRVGRGEESKE